ncbi:hypothetical protein [Streptococcus sp. DD12]|uniref:hypothetical protein n=1 Tax=Streptococcus sp. DD12 TaxID=1777880 RepID=UPI00082BCA24|nr:hypothetical protein [Streptococcus sp. DD12]
MTEIDVTQCVEESERELNQGNGPFRGSRLANGVLADCRREAVRQPMVKSDPMSHVFNIAPKP